MSLDPALRSRIESILNANRVVLFMKGQPSMPQCGFSAKAVGALQDLGVEFAHVNVLADQEIREGIKVYGDWPTIPQLYIDGELVGGSDIVLQMAASGELSSVLGLAAPVASLLGWCWCRSRGVRVVLLGMLGVSSGFFVVMVVRGQLPPSLALHTLLDLAVGIVAMLVFFLVQACRARWHKDRSSFGVRCAVLLLLTAGYVLFALLAIDRAGAGVVQW